MTCTVAVVLAGTALGQSQPQDLTQMAIEDLMRIQVTSVSRKGQPLSKAGAAVYVITQEEIRRSGATNIPDLLRLAPGVNVARINNSVWAIGVRGFNDVHAGKLLVLIDGRSVYSPLFSGVYWDQQQVPLEDIERIEVIRGPGGTVWGANAVNGVINIITKSAWETPGGMVTAGAGSKDLANTLVQYGDKIGSAGAYRVFGRYAYTGRSELTSGGPAPDLWRVAQGGFRSDFDLTPRDRLMLQGDLLQSVVGARFIHANRLTPADVDAPVGGRAGSFLARWDRTLAGGSQIALQGFYNYNDRINENTEQYLHTADLEFQYRVRLGSRNDVLSGLGYRASSIRFRGNDTARMHPASGTDCLYSAFIQDEILLTKSVALTVGSKFEHNAYTGYESEPSAQLVWTPTPHHTLWGSAAKAIRQPSRSDSGLEVLAAILPQSNASYAALTLFGSPATKSEELRDFEAGYRTQLTPRLSLDAVGFLSYYRRLRTAEPGTPYFVAGPGAPHLVIPLTFDNKARARNYGAELFASWHATERWKLGAGVTFLNMRVTRDAASRDSTVEQLPGYSPRRQFQVRSYITLPRRWEWDQTVGYTSRLPRGNIPAYVRLDTRVGWRAGESFEFSVVGQNLLQPRHAEFPDFDQYVHTLDQRSVFAKITWRF